MKPPSFDYVRATTLAEAHAVLAAEGNAAQIVAGGQTLLPLLSMRLARPKVLVDIMRLGELTRLQEADGEIHVGADAQPRYGVRLDGTRRSERGTSPRAGRARRHGQLVFAPTAPHARGRGVL